MTGWQSCKDKKSFSGAILNALGEHYGFSLETPFQDYPQDVQDIILYGTGGQVVNVPYKGQRGEGIYDIAFEGLIRSVERRYRENITVCKRRET